MSKVERIATAVGDKITEAVTIFWFKKLSLEKLLSARYFEEGKSPVRMEILGGDIFGENVSRCL